MALLKCSECGGRVSDKADFCPHCGISIEKILRETKTAINNLNIKETTVIEFDEDTDNFEIVGTKLLKCNSIKPYLQVPEVVYEIAEDAFWECDKIEKLKFLGSLKSFGKTMQSGYFDFCSELSEIIVDTCNENFTSLDGVLYNKNLSELIAFPPNKHSSKSPVLNGGNVVFESPFEYEEFLGFDLPNTITKISSFAFEKCYSLISIKIPQGISEISHAAFSGCINLDKVILHNSITKIEQAAFYGCESLTNVFVPESVTSIGRHSFAECKSLTHIEIHYNTNVYKSAFEGCHPSLKIKWYGKPEGLKASLNEKSKKVSNKKINESIKICPGCNKEIVDKISCPYCYTIIKKVCIECFSDNQPNENYCQNCGCLLEILEENNKFDNETNDFLKDYKNYN